MMIKFNSQTKNLLIQRGKIEDDSSRKFIRNALGITGKKVEATKHTILSGPPGVGKTHGTLDECKNAGVQSLMISPGATDVEIVCSLAYAIYTLPNNQDLAVILDDADDVVFGNYERMNKWKLAMADANYSIGSIPHFTHAVNMMNTINALNKNGKTDIAEAITSFQVPGQIGVSIPTDRVRFIVLCNKDLEDPKTFSRQTGMRSAVEAIMDRFKYKRMKLDWEAQWGWLAHVLSQSQPFDKYALDDGQKKELLEWMYSNWANLRGTSYRTVRKLAAAMINNPNDYEDEWREELKGN